jgi:hypothetical protein
MKTLFYKSALSAAIAASLISCGGGSGVAGIGGSGFVATGAITGFGSVFVNGVEFETSGTVFDIDDSGSGSQNDLAVGMVVTVNGTVNADGITGNANSISFDDQLQGPVSGLTAPDPDGEKRSFTILGTTVRINALDTVFDVTGLLSGTAFDFDLIANGNSVEVSGFFNDAGELVATRVELKASTFSTSDIVELKGSIFGLINTSFSVNGVNVDASGAAIDDLPGGLTEGASVEVKGTCSDLSCSTIIATRVEGQNGFDDADKISVEGLITDFVDSSNFKINGIGVNATSATTLSPTTLVLRDGLRVEVEGPISNNVIQAISVELRGGSAKVHATVNSVDSATGNFVVGVNADTIDVTVTTATQIEGTVSANNFVRVRGFENATGGITATRVEVRQDDDVIVQGNMSAFSGTTITLIGVSFQVDYNGGAGETDFEDINDAPLTQGEFQTQAPLGTLVKVKDKNGQPVLGVADEIEIELD